MSMNYLDAVNHHHSMGKNTLCQAQRRLPSEESGDVEIDDGEEYVEDVLARLREMSDFELSKFMESIDDDKHPLEMKAFLKERGRRESIAAERYLEMLGERA